MNDVLHIEAPSECPQCGGRGEHIRATHTGAKYQLYQCRCNYLFVRALTVTADATQ